ncbi:MAG: thiamine phosphate synthase [Rhodospirillales bacterium]
MNDCRLYLITPPRLEPSKFAVILARALEAGDVASVQIRLKEAIDDDIRWAAEALGPVVRDRGAAFILNDRPDLAKEMEFDGVHIGQDDASLPEARQAVGADGIVGVTCHDSRHLAMVAAENGADYVSFGAFFPTPTKKAKTRADAEIIEIWSETTIVPLVAIGGITPQNCSPLVRAGADFLAVSSGIWDHPKGPAAAVREFEEAIGRCEAP